MQSLMKATQQAGVLLKLTLEKLLGGYVFFSENLVAFK
jgi:hypothetical protein